MDLTHHLTLGELCELNEYTQVMEAYEQEANDKAMKDAKKSRRG